MLRGLFHSRWTKLLDGTPVMERSVTLPPDFAELLNIPNAPPRFEEALDVADKIVGAGVELLPNPDHAAIFTDPPH